MAAPAQETYKQNITFWQGFLVSLISGVTTIVLAAIFLGGTLQRLAQVEVRAEKFEQRLEKNEAKAEQQNKEIGEKLENIQQRMVNKDDFQELRRDFKEFSKGK